MNAMTAIAKPLAALRSRTIGSVMMLATSGPQRRPNARYPVTRGRRKNAKSQPTIDAAMSATPSASAADPAGSLPSRVTSSHARAIVIASAATRLTRSSSAASGARPQARRARTLPCRPPRPTPASLRIRPAASDES